MNPRVLFVIEGDPRSSARPAEAVRIAAGVAAWKKARISIYLRAEAILALSEYTDELIDEEVFTRFMPIIGENGGSVYVQAGSPWLRELGEPRLNFEPINDHQLAGLSAEYVIRFADEPKNGTPPPEPNPPVANTESSPVLHILTHPNDSLGRKMAADCAPASVADLTAAEPDYDALLDAIFRADSVRVW